MDALAAKDFLVQQAVEQAALDQVPLSDLEKRMMYFTETGEMTEDALALNDAFEAEYDDAEYEAKIGKLMRRTHARLKEESPSLASTWDEAVQELRKGDHYLLVLLGDTSGQFLNPALSSWSFWKLLGVAILVLILGMILFVVMLHHADSMPLKRP
jgi:hypothetical protein